MNSRARPRLAILLVLLTAGAGGMAFYRSLPRGGQAASPAESPALGTLVAGADPVQAEAWATAASEEARAALATLLRVRFNRKNMRANEAVLTFKDSAAYRNFLARVAGAGAR